MATTKKQPSRAPSQTGSGWITFAATYLAIAGLLNGIWGVVALSKKGYFDESGLVWEHLHFWGWAGIIVAVIQMIGAYLIVTRRLSGLILGLVLGMMGILLNFFTIGAYPVWSCIAIVCNALVLWAVTVHGEQNV